VVFLFSGKFLEKKRPLDFVYAMARARLRVPYVRGFMVGDGELRSACEALAERVLAPVSFGGFLNQSEIKAAYLGSDVLVLPSDGETWGLVVNEAMSAGKPCIVSDRVGAGPDLVDTDITGHIFRMGDVDQLASLMAECAGDRERLAGMGAAARNKMKAYSVATSIQGIQQALECVL
jgi:glycosyltransferase involved in cell wall biosynthesis